MKPASFPARIISTILILAFLTGLTACAGNDTDTPGSDTSETAAEETTERLWLDGLPDQMDFNGKTVSCLGFDLFTPQSDVPKEVVSRAEYDKRNNVAIRLNLDIRFVQNDAGDDYAYKTISRAVQGDMYEFDFICGYGLYIASKALFEGDIIDLAKADSFDYIDLSAPWWQKEFNDALSVGSSYYWLYGYLSNVPDNLYAVIVNLDMSKLFLTEETIYDIVNSGEWTLDELLRISKLAYLDDGNGERDENDRYGFAVPNPVYIDTLATCADADYTTRDAENFPVCNINTERNIGIAEKIYDLYQDSSAIRGTEAPPEKQFGANRLLFLGDELGNSARYRDMKEDFGIIPFPKYDEYQENYLTTPFQNFPLAGIPVTTPAEQYEAIFALWEMSAAECYRIVRPAFLDEAMKNKYSRDEETKKMVDLVCANVTTDFMLVYGEAASDMNRFFSHNCLDTRDVSSKLQRQSKGVSRVVESLVDKAIEVSENS